MSAAPNAYCEIADCIRPAFRGGLCSAHLKRQQRGKTGLSLAQPIAERLTPKERMLEAGSAWLEAGDDDAEYEAAERAFLRAIDAYMRSRGWSPPQRRGPHRAVRRRPPAQMDLPLD